MCCPLVFEFSVSIGGFVIGLGQISFFFSSGHTLTCCLNLVKYRFKNCVVSIVSASRQLLFLLNNFTNSVHIPGKTAYSSDFWHGHILHIQDYISDTDYAFASLIPSIWMCLLFTMFSRNQ